MSTPQGPGDRVERAVLRDGVYDRLLRLLLEGALAPGSRLSIEALARRLAVSPTPVREALANLEHTGLVMREPLRGYRVAPPLTAEQLDNLIDVRLLVERAALQGAMRHEPRLGARLQGAHDHDVEVVDRHDLHHAKQGTALEVYLEYFEADWGFHRAILQSCRNEYLERVGEGLSFQVHRMRQTYDAHVIDADDAVREHAVILDAVRDGDQAAAITALERHLEGVRERSVARPTAEG